MALLDVSRLHKKFGGLHAVNDVSFGVEKGAIKAVIGPNGAGKSTSIGCISGLLKPTDGQIRVNGEIEMTTYNDSAPDYIPGLYEQWSGWHFRTDETRAIQADDFETALRDAIESPVA